MEKKHNIAIVGCGVISQIHIAILKKLKRVNLIAVCDLDENKAVSTSKKWKIDHYYTDFNHMLEKEDISILSILTPPSSHAFLSIEAMKNGINVVIEKPLTMKIEEAQSIIKSLHKNNVKMIVVYHWLFTKSMMKALSLINEGVIGEVLNVNMTMIQNSKYDPMASDHNHWCHKILGGRFGEMLPHPIYTLQSILGNDLSLKEVLTFKRGNLPWLPKDELTAILQSKKGIGSLYVSLNSTREAINMEVYGTKELLNIDLNRHIILRRGPIEHSNKINLGKDTISEAWNLTSSTIKNAYDFVFKKRGEYSISNVYNAFIDDINKDIPSIITPEMSYNTVRIVEEISENIL